MRHGIEDLQAGTPLVMVQPDLDILTLRVGNNQGILDVVPGATPHWRQAGACEK
jgi:hypothetical protein